MIETALRFRNYAEELRVIAADKTTTENRETLLRVAADYERIADSFDAIIRSKNALGLSP
jgi:hypothetical protein